MKNNPLKGKRYISLLRCSTGKQADTSIPDQKKVNDAFAREAGMVHVRDVEAPGISASKTFNRADLEDLIEEAVRLKSFDVLLVHDFSRLTRGGIRHAAFIRRRFEKAGVRVVSANDNIPEGDEAEFFEAFIHYKNKTYAKQLGQQVARGSRSSLEAGRRPHCAHTPFGFDRMYIGPDGKPRCILRQIDGTMRHLIDCITGAVREIRPDDSGHFIPFIKQQDETSKLVLGAPEIVEAVRKMFEMRYKDGRSYTEIIDELKRRGIKPSFAAFWHKSVTRDILLSSIYLGRAVACKVALGVHCVLGPNGFQSTPVEQSDYEDGDRLTIDPIHRPREEWWERKEVHLLDYITDPIVRERATAAIDAADEKFLSPKPANYLKLKNAKREAHRNSSYILRDLLRSKDGDFAYKGCTQGKGNKYRRTYVVSAYAAGNPKASHLANYLPANQLDTAVLSVLRQCFESNRLMAGMIREAVTLYTEKAAKEVRDETALRREDQNLAKKIRKLIAASNVGGETDDADDAQIANWKQRREHIKLELSAVTADVKSIDVEKVIEDVATLIFTPQEKLEGEDYFFLRNLVNAWCFDMRVDNRTRELTFAVGVPSASGLAALSRGAQLCPQSDFTQQTLLEAQNNKMRFSARFRCFGPIAVEPNLRKWPRGWQYECERVDQPTKPKRGPKRAA